MLTLILLANTDPAIPTQPGLRPGLTEDQITPGLLGFIITFGIVVIMFFLIRDMSKRVRRVRYRAQVEAERDGVPTEYLGIPIMSDADIKNASYANAFRDADPVAGAKETDAKNDGGTPVPAHTPAPGAATAAQDSPAQDEK